MALQAKAIKQKMRSVGNIKKITRTMETISVSKMKRAVSEAQASKKYAFAVFDLLSYISRENGLKKSSYLFNKKKEGTKLIVVMSSDKGLCGAYNMNIYKKLVAFRGKYGDDIECITVGRHSEHMANKLGIKIIASFVRVSERNSEEQMRALAKIAILNFKEKSHESVFVLYTDFIKASRFEPIIREILPLNEKMAYDVLTESGFPEKNGFKRENFSSYIFEPNESFILETILPRLVESIFEQCFLEAAASEHSSRMFAMKAASDSASYMFDSLNISYNYARQDAITRELSEIVGGSGAMENQ